MTPANKENIGKALVMSQFIAATVLFILSFQMQKLSQVYFRRFVKYDGAALPLQDVYKLDTLSR